MALTDTVAGRPHPLSKHASWLRWRYPLSIVLALMVLAGLARPVAAVLAQTQSPVSCKLHQGEFGNDLSTDFDISRIDCRSAWMKDSPTLHIWGVSPYVGIEWRK